MVAWFYLLYLSLSCLASVIRTYPSNWNLLNSDSFLLGAEIESRVILGNITRDSISAPKEKIISNLTIPITEIDSQAEIEKDETIKVHSGEVQYDGKEIVLVGQVSVQHGLGQISARRLSLLFDSQQKNRFAFLKLQDDVQLELKEGGCLYCQGAEVDYAKMQGVFWGNAKCPDVIYLNTREEKKTMQSIQFPLEVKSHQMICELLRESATSSSPAKTLVKQIEAINNVRVLYNRDQLILADHALYQRLATHASCSDTGLLTLSGRGTQPVCRLTNLNGDHLNAQRIQVNTMERQLRLDQADGMLYMRQEKRPLQTLEFSSNELIWEGQKQTLWLKGQVKVTQNGTFHIQTDDEIAIMQTDMQGKKTLRSIQSLKNTQISYQDVQKGNTHKIHCPGALLIDHEQQQMTFQGITNANPSPQAHQQVYIEDLLGDLYADRVQVFYTWKERHLIPEKIILEGNVRLLNRFDGHLEESGSILHYALADRVEYLPSQQEMTLSSTKGQRVLFFDKVNQVQMSAPSLKIRRDVTTQKETIQGVGDVRFTFIEKEMEQIKKHFRLEDIKEADHVPTET